MNIYSIITSLLSFFLNLNWVNTYPIITSLLSFFLNLNWDQQIVVKNYSEVCYRNRSSRKFNKVNRETLNNKDSILDNTVSFTQFPYVFYYNNGWHNKNKHKTGFLKREPASNCMDTYIYKEKLGMLSVLTNISG